MTAGAATDAREVAKFEAIAAEWWDPRGPFRPLHLMTPCRLDYAVGQIGAEHDRDRRAPRPFAGLRVLDVGCGGGLLCEPMARLGAEVVGIDPSQRTVEVARAHAAASGLAVEYRAATAATLAEAGERFDAVLAMEVVEHVPDTPGFLEDCAALLAPGGLIVLSTINRTLRSYALAIVAAERVLRWLPPGTHDWRRFITPDELSRGLVRAGLEPVDRKGMVLDPLAGEWRLSAGDLSVNYVLAARRPG